MSTAYSGDGITFPDNSVQATAPRVGMVNRIINGDMRIDQRNAGAAITATGFSVDRWQMFKSAPGGLSVQRSTVAPSGFTNSIGITVTSANSPAATDFAAIRQSIEGLNVADFAWGTSGAQAVTLGFWVRSSIVGNYSWSLLNSAETRGYVSSFTVNTANTWEFKALTIPGDTSGTWLTDNGTGLRCMVGLGVGTTYSTTAGSWQSFNYAYGLAGGVSLIANAGATFYVTGVQLEKGSTATDFEYVDYGRQLQMCQRYYQEACSVITTTGQYLNHLRLPVVMRTGPSVGTITFDTGTGATFSNAANTGNGTAGLSLYQSANHSTIGTATKIPLSSEL
jgi:hypothetical protein